MNKYQGEKIFKRGKNHIIFVLVVLSLAPSVDVPVGISKEDAQQAAMQSENVLNFLEGKTPKKVIYVPGRLINIVI